MKENIFNLIRTDINVSRFLYFQRKYLKVESDRLNTHNSDVILCIMQIKSSDEIHGRYFELVDSAHYLNEGEEMNTLLNTIFGYLVSLQRNPETRINELQPEKIGALTICYHW